MNWMRSASSRWLTAIALFAAILIIVSVLVSILSDNRKVDFLSINTPEGTVQRYLLALAEDDLSTAYSYASTNLKNECTLEHFLDMTKWREESFSASLKNTSELDDRTIVTVEITEPSGSQPFGRGGYSFDTSFTLTLENGEWRISKAPWPVGWCPPDRGIPSPATREPATAAPGPDAAPVWFGLRDEGALPIWSS